MKSTFFPIPFAEYLDEFNHCTKGRAALSKFEAYSHKKVSEIMMCKCYGLCFVILKNASIFCVINFTYAVVSKLFVGFVSGCVLATSR